MSIDRALRELIRAELRALLEPLQATLTELHGQRALIEHLAAALGHPVKRGRGRPKRVTTPTARLPAPEAPARVENAGRACAVIGCKRPARSKGYCAAHYQKYRMLSLTLRLPPGWVEDALPQSVENVMLPRGRAGAKALAEAKKP